MNDEVSCRSVPNFALHVSPFTLHPSPFRLSFPLMIITCPRCDEDGDPDSSLYEPAPAQGALKIGDRFIRETISDVFYCRICEAKGIYCEAEVQEEG